MAIRIRVIDGKTIALCAARSVAKAGDIYLDDATHYALTRKLARDFNEMFDVGLPDDEDETRLVEVEESNNANRETWDKWMDESVARVRTRTGHALEQARNGKAK